MAGCLGIGLWLGVVAVAGSGFEPGGCELDGDFVKLVGMIGWRCVEEDGVKGIEIGDAVVDGAKDGVVSEDSAAAGLGNEDL